MTVGKLIKELARFNFDDEIRLGIIPKGNRRIPSDLRVEGMNLWGDLPHEKTKPRYVMIQLSREEASDG